MVLFTNVPLIGLQEIIMSYVRRLPVGRIGGSTVFNARSAFCRIRINEIDEPVPAFVRWSFLLFVFTFGLESAGLPFLNTGRLSIARLSGLIFFASYFWYCNPLVGNALPAVPPPFWWFSAYIALFLIHPFIAQESGGTSVGRMLTMLQLFVLFWLASDLLRSSKIVRGVLWSYSASWFIVAAGLVFNLPGFSVEEMGRAGERLTVEGYNPNGLALGAGAAALSLFGLFLNRKTKGLFASTWILCASVPLLLAVAKSGSRGGAIAFAVGFFVFLLPISRSSKKVVAWLAAGFGAIGLVYLIASNPLLFNRWEKTYYEGDTAGRQVIIAAGTEMFLERPLLGWGYVELETELGYRMGLLRPKGSHNLVLHLLLEVGVVGAVPFFVGLFLCVKAAWRARRGPQGVLPLAILVTILVGSLAGHLLAKKDFWLILALAMGAERQALSLDRLRQAFAARSRRTTTAMPLS
jgi:O-antigen ligase